jgi:ferrous iron transport protein A
MITLCHLSPGQSGRILAIEGQDALSQRLGEMGLLEGEVVRVLAIAPLGDPIEIRVGASTLSLRKSEAARVALEPLA